MKWILLALMLAVIGAGVAFLALATKEDDGVGVLPTPAPSAAITPTAPQTPTPTTTTAPTLVPTLNPTLTPTLAPVPKPTNIPTTPEPMATAEPTTTAEPLPTATPDTMPAQGIEEALGVVKAFLTAVNNKELATAGSYLSPELLFIIREKGFLYLEKEFGPIIFPLELVRVQRSSIDESLTRVHLRIQVKGIKGGEGLLAVELKKNGRWTINLISNS